MNKKKNQQQPQGLIRLLGLSGTWNILHLLFKNGRGTYKEFTQSTNTRALNMRLNELIEHNLIEHRQVRNPRREWYEITERGREIFGLVLKILEVKD